MSEHKNPCLLIVRTEWQRAMVSKTQRGKTSRTRTYLAIRTHYRQTHRERGLTKTRIDRLREGMMENEVDIREAALDLPSLP